MAIFERRLIRPSALLDAVQQRGAATTKELKEHFGVDSSSIRRSLAPLFAADGLWIVSSGKVFYYMVNTGAKGQPIPNRARKAAQRGELSYPGHPLDYKQEMMKQILVFNEIGWGLGDVPNPPAPIAEKVYSFDDDEAEELDYGDS
jgi:hypothetical protein